MQPYILVVDDDSGLTRLLSMLLEPVGYRVRVAHDGPTALNAINKKAPDLMVLDVMLPGLDGVEVCRKVRERHSLPIIALTCLTDTKHKAQMLDAGADDYLTKPFRPNVLLSRVQEALRDTSQGIPVGDDGLITIGSLQLDIARGSASLGDREIPLTRTEYRLLCQLAAHPGQIQTHHMLLQNVWGREYVHDWEYLHVYVGRLRRKIEADPAHPASIVTIPGIGYKMLAPRLHSTA